MSGHLTGFARNYAVFSPGHGPFGNLKSDLGHGGMFRPDLG